jgi:hypothetical protein
LRQERDKEKNKVDSLREELKKMKEKLSPVEASLRKTEAEYEAVKKENGSLQESVAHWRDSFLKGSHVDPDEHRKALSRVENLENVNNNYLELIDSHQTKIDELSLAVSELTQSAAVTTAALQEQQALALKSQEEKTKLEADLGQEQARLATERSNSEKLRKTCRDFKEKLTTAKAETDTLKSELEVAKGELEVAKSENDSLKTQASTVVRPKASRVKPVAAKDVAAETSESTATSTTFGTAHRTEPVPEVVEVTSVVDPALVEPVEPVPVDKGVSDASKTADAMQVETPIVEAVTKPAVKRMKRKQPTEADPVVTETVPAVTETVPVVMDTTPVVAETVPAVAETVPVTESVPVVMETTSVVAETTQVHTEVGDASKVEVEVVEETIVQVDDVAKTSSEVVASVTTTTEVTKAAPQEATTAVSDDKNALQMMRMQLLKRKKAPASAVVRTAEPVAENATEPVVTAATEVPSPVTKKVKISEESGEDKAMSEAIEILFDADSSAMDTDGTDPTAASEPATREGTEVAAGDNDEAAKKVTSFGKSLTLEERQKKFGRSASSTPAKTEVVHEASEVQSTEVAPEQVQQAAKPKTRKIKPPPKVKTTPEKETKPSDE